jgi:hypothetical protein
MGKALNEAKSPRRSKPVSAAPIEARGGLGKM